ncbi:MAG: S1C family serine protease [Hyphomonadaceae bacterium]
MGRVSGFALLGGATASVTGCVTALTYTGASDSDPTDPVGYGRTGITDADGGVYADPIGRGRGRIVAGLTDADAGPYADPVGRGRAGRRLRGPATGSGFFISTEGHLVTSYHIVRDRPTVTVVRDGQDYPAQILASDPANDIAILKIDAPSVPLPIGSARDVRVGEDIIALGFPLAAIQGQEMRATFGRVNALSSLNSDTRHLQVDAPVQPGNSGGPLIGPDGRVIGIMSARLDDIATLTATGALPQNVSFSIRIDFLTAILPPDVELNTSPLTGSTADRVAAARPSIAFIRAEPAPVISAAGTPKPEPGGPVVQVPADQPGSPHAPPPPPPSPPAPAP